MLKLRRKTSILHRNKNQTPAVHGGKPTIFILRRRIPKILILRLRKSKINHRRKVLSSIVVSSVDDELEKKLYLKSMLQREMKVGDYMVQLQPDFDDTAREFLVDWLVRLHHKWDLANQTLYLTVNILDRFLALETVSKREFQCVGMTAMLIASKYEELQNSAVPTINHFVYYNHDFYTNEEMVDLEKRILSRLAWKLTLPTPVSFLPHFIQLSIAHHNSNSPSIMENMTYLYAELGLMNYEISTRFYPSMLAAAAVYVARVTLLNETNHVWPHEPMEIHTGYTEMQVIECAKMMVAHRLLANEYENIRVVLNKYSSETRDAVVHHPLPVSLLDPSLT